MSAVAENLLAAFVSLSGLTLVNEPAEGSADRIQMILNDSVAAYDLGAKVIKFWDCHRDCVSARKSVACDDLLFRFALDAFIGEVVAGEFLAKNQYLAARAIPTPQLERVGLN